MTYAIGYFVYGINLNDANLDSDEIENYATTRYSGSGEPPMYMGVDLGSIDECSDMVWEDLQAIHDKVTPAIITQFRAASRAALDDPDIPEEFRQILETSEPTIFLTWGSS